MVLMEALDVDDQRKGLVLILVSKNTNTKLCLKLHYHADNNYLFVNGK